MELRWWLKIQCCRILWRGHPGISIKKDTRIDVRSIDFWLNSQVATKSISPIINRKNIQNALKFLERIYLANAKSVENRALMQNFSDSLEKLIKSLILVAIIAYFIFITSPLILYFIDDSQLIPILPWVWPGTLPGTTRPRDYVINQAYNLFAMFLAIDFYMILTVHFTFFLLHVMLLNNIMSIQLEAIDHQVSSRNPSLCGIKFSLRNIILMHNELSSWVAIYIYLRPSKNNFSLLLYSIDT